MNPALGALLLSTRRFAFVTAGPDLCVLDVVDPAALLGAGLAWAGRSLLELVPEFTGNERDLEEVLAGAQPRYELPLVNRELASGEAIYLNLYVLPGAVGDEAAPDLTVVAEDVTAVAVRDQRLAQHRNELRLLHERLQQQNRELAAANAELRQVDEVKSVFLSVTGHELRTPLTAILGYVEMLLNGDMGPLVEAQSTALQHVQAGGYRLVAITDQLIDVARLESGRVELLLQPHVLADIALQLFDEFAADIAARGQHLSLDAPPGLPLALCDRARAAQILSNLIGNASKYTPPGGVINVTVGPAGEEGFLQVAVADTGVGIAPADQAHVFKRFFRASDPRTAGTPGTGLGLYITRALVDLHGGRIWFTSVPGAGSTFYVTLPVAGHPQGE